jgi:hypothetical protein
MLTSQNIFGASSWEKLPIIIRVSKSWMKRKVDEKKKIEIEKIVQNQSI